MVYNVNILFSKAIVQKHISACAVCLKIGAHHIKNTHNISRLSKLASGYNTFSKTVFKSFKSHIQTDLVSVSKNINNSPSLICNTCRNTVNRFFFHTISERITREADESGRKVVYGKWGYLRAMRDSNPRPLAPEAIILFQFYLL